MADFLEGTQLAGVASSNSSGTPLQAGRSPVDSQRSPFISFAPLEDDTEEKEEKTEAETEVEPESDSETEFC